MRGRRRMLTWGALITMGVALIVIFTAVMERRFVEGDIYPYYASFRSDPLGTSAFYETLNELPDYEVSRNVSHLNNISGLDEDTTLLLLGYPRDDLQELRAPEDSPVMKAVKKGARLVITVNPELVPEKFRPARSEEEDDWLERRRKLREDRLREEKDSRIEDPTPEGGSSDEDVPGSKAGEEEEEFESRMISMFGARMTSRLGFNLMGLEEYERPENGWETEVGKSFSAKRSELAVPTWYSQYRLEIPDKSWHAVAAVDGKAVVVERRWGRGSIVVATDSFFVSNEALHREAVPEFLIWLVGKNSKVVFDETIHGTLETGGTMKLIRYYRLHGVFLGIIFFVVLWAWRSSSSLAPGSEELERGLVAPGGAITGQPMDGGLIHLLKKSIPRKDLLEHCVEIWHSSRQREVLEKNEKQVREILARHQSDPKKFGVVEAFRSISEALRRR